MFLPKWLWEIWYQLRHWNKGLYPPGKIPSQRTFHIKNVAVVKAMFDRAGLSYTDLSYKGFSRGHFSVKIPKTATRNNPEYLCFIDRMRFWNFTQDSWRDPDYHIVTFDVHAYTRTEAFTANVLGKIPAPVKEMWSLIPR